MLDEDFKVYLIEINTNPSLDCCCPLLERLIPEMMEATFKIVVDPLFPPPESLSSSKFSGTEGGGSSGMEAGVTKYELVFDEQIDVPYMTEILKVRENYLSKLVKTAVKDNKLPGQHV